MKSTPKKSILYVDESGNTGPDYLEESQPFYVLAGWVVPEEQSEEAWIAVEQLRVKISPQSEELKSSLIKRGERQKNEIAAFFEKLVQIQCLPMYLVSEKRFCVAGKIVETFLDPEYNPLLQRGFSGDFTSKKEIANQLYDLLPKPELIQFAQAYRQPTADGLGEALQAVAESASKMLSPEHSEAFLGSTQEIKAIAEEEASSSPFGSVGATLNLPSLVSFLMMAENLGRLGFHQPIKIVHDQHQAYEDGYKKIFELHQKLPRLFATLPNHDFAYGRLESVAEFETADSKDRLPIQAADLLAGTINHLMILAQNNAEPTEAELRLARLLLPLLFEDGIKLAWPVWSDSCMNRVVESLIMKIVNTKPPSEEEVQIGQALAEAQDAPLLPSGSRSTGLPKFALPTPMYAFTGIHSGNLLVMDPPDELVSEGGITVTPFFSTANDAAVFLEDHLQGHVDEELQIVEFDGPDMHHLVELLNRVSDRVSAVLFDPLSKAESHVFLPVLLEGLQAILNRFHRLMGSGLAKVVVKESVTEDGRKATTMLLSDGRYGAMWHPASMVVAGTTREEALAILQKENPAVESPGNE